VIGSSVLSEEEGLVGNHPERPPTVQKLTLNKLLISLSLTLTLTLSHSHSHSLSLSLSLIYISSKIMDRVIETHPQTIPSRIAVVFNMLIVWALCTVARTEMRGCV